MAPTYVYFNGFEDMELEEDIRLRGYETTKNNKRASFVVFAEDPNKTLFRLPPRNFGSREEFIENIRKSEAKKGWN